MKICCFLLLVNVVFIVGECCFFVAVHNYKVHVFTGDIRRAGTDANVFITLIGENGDSGERPLSVSETHRDKFERGQVRNS